MKTSILNDSPSLNFIYSKDELAAIYARRNKYKNNKAETIVAEDFTDFVRQNKLNFE